ncbi:MAG: hypothetical protein AAF478_10840, partial [Pseudomonadota bacterium]
MEFSEYAKVCLNTSEFVTSYEDDKSQLFHTPLDSFLHLSRWTLSAKDGFSKSFSFKAGYIDIFSPNAFADRFSIKLINT